MATQERTQEYVELQEIEMARWEILNLRGNPPEARTSRLYSSAIKLLTDAKKHAKRVEQLSQKIRQLKQKTGVRGRLAGFVDAVLKRTVVAEINLEKELDSVIKMVQEAERADSASRVPNSTLDNSQVRVRNLNNANERLVTIYKQLFQMFKLEGKIDRFLEQPGA